MKSTLVCLPTYNEADNLRAIIPAILEAAPGVDVLVIDDRSPDGTGDIADEFAASNNRVFVLHRERKEGLGRAYLAAFQWALQRDYQLILEMDADFSHSPVFLPQLILEAERGTDLVLGSRYVLGGGTRNWGILRKILSRGGSVYARAVLGITPRDLTGGFKCFKRHVLEALDLATVRSTGYAFQIELTYRTLQKGFKVTEIPIIFEDRRVGKSKMNGQIFTEALWGVWKMKRSSATL